MTLACDRALVCETPHTARLAGLMAGMARRMSGAIAIIAIAVVLLIIGLVILQVFRRGKVRPESQVPRPDEEGHAGRVDEFRD